MTKTSESANKTAVADANAQLQSLNRVSHRLAMVDNAQRLQAVLDKLLPRLLQRIGDNNQAQSKEKDAEVKSVLSKIQMKLVEILSHVMKRVRDDQDCRLVNARGILDLILTTRDDNSYEGTLKQCDSFSLNLSLAFLTLAIPRCTLSELDDLLPGLLILHACYERRVRLHATNDSASSPSLALESMRKQWHQVSHLLLRTLEGIVAEEEYSPTIASGKVITASTKKTNNNKRIKTTAKNGVKINDESTDKPETPSTGLKEARSLLSQQELEKSQHQISIEDATYSLFLDALLYQTQVGNVPPPGMSSAGWDRFKSGHSVLERDWAAEMAPPHRLSTFKNRILEWIAPHRRFCLFMDTNDDNSKGSDRKDDVSNKGTSNLPISLVGRSRTVALLVVASGDPMKGVSEPAKQYLKQYYDSQRETGGFGNATILIKELLTLCVGGINAESILAASPSTDNISQSALQRGTLGILHGGMPFRRRQVSDNHFSELTLTANKALDDINSDFDDDIDSIGKLSMLASDKMLSKLRNALGLTLLRGRPYIAAAELLKGFLVRLQNHRRRHQEIYSTSSKKFTFEARALRLCVRVLAPISASKASSSSSAQISEASVSVRDSIYGTISILCRSQFAQEQFLCLLAAGETENDSFSTDLLQLLFRCIGNEIDKLRPRATACLDALLFACRRMVECRGKTRKGQQNQTILTGGDNPWGDNLNSTTSHATTNDFKQSETSISPIIIGNQLGKSLLPILWAASHPSQSRQSRVAAARWSSDLLVDLDEINAIHILCSLAGDTDVTAAAIAKQGLGIQGSKSIVIADFDELTHLLISEDEYMMSTTSVPTFWDFPPIGKAVAVKCLLRSYLDDFNGGERGLCAFMGLLTKCLALKDTGKNKDVIDACSEGLSICIETSSISRAMLHSSSLDLGLHDIREMVMSTNSAKAKRFLADTFGNFLMDTSLLGSEWTEIVTEALTITSKILLIEPIKTSNDVKGAALLGGTCVRLVRLHPELVRHDIYDLASKLLTRLGSALTHDDDLIGNVFCDAILLACSDGHTMELHNSLKPGMVSVLQNVTSALNKFGHGDRMNAPRLLKLIEPSGLAIAVSTGLPKCSECVEALFKLLGSDGFRKDEEIALVIGEALTLFAEASSTNETDAASIIGTEKWPLGMNEEFARSLSPPLQIIFTLLRTAKTTSNNHKRRACASALLAVVARATRLEPHENLRICLQHTLHEIQNCFLSLLADSKSNQMSRESCCLGLVACNKIVAASESEELQARLLRSFGSTTNHGGSAMQETAEQAAQRRRAEGANVSESLEATTGVDVGGAGGVSEAALGAYREMAAAAVGSGRPDILYSMLILSVSHPVWFSSEKRRDAYGPTSLQGDNFSNGEVKIALRPFLSQLLPRILRASHDPNKRTQEQMETLWIGLTGGGEEGRKAISDNLRPTIDALVEETSSKSWRARVGACGALSQICVGRSWADLGGGPPILDENYDLVISKTPPETTSAGIRLLRLWRAVIRALDDVRITVREAGESLGRSVRGLTIFLCNPYIEGPDRSTQFSKEEERDAISASATALRWLLRNGLKQQCAEAAGICISALIGIIDIAKPAILEALLSDVIHALLMAMSNLEPAAFSYLAVRGERGSTEYENLARLRIQVSQSSPLATAVRKCIDLVPKSRSLKNQEAVVPALESAIRKSSGMATRTAAAECVITLCRTCPHMFQCSSSSSSLLRCFYEAVYRERGGKAAQDKMNSAFGSLSALCPGAVIRPLASSATDRYIEAHGSNDDAATRHASAMILRSIAVKASIHFSNPGNSNVWCGKILPISFLGMRDPNKSVALLWRDVWEDGGAAINLGSSEDDSGNTLEESLLLSLANECVKALEDKSWSRRVTGADALTSLAEKQILGPPPGRLDGQYSRSVQARARKRAQASRTALFSLIRLLSRNRIWTGKHEVLRAAVQLSKVWIPFAATKEAEALLGEPGLVPVSFGDSASERDLFLNDAFFDTKDLKTVQGQESDNDEVFPVRERFLSDEIPTLLLLGICRQLLKQSFPQKSATRSVPEGEVLPYRSHALQSLEMLLKSLPDTEYSSHFRGRVFSYLTPKLWEVFGNETINQQSPKESPLIIARCIRCFASCSWSGMQYQDIEQASTIEISALLQIFSFHTDFSRQSAWTVREAATKGASKVAECADFDTLQRRQTVSSLVDIARIALKDRKFWKVRLGGLEVLLSLVLRVGDHSRSRVIGSFDKSNQEKQLILETILPHKENIEALAKRSLIDSEAKITALSTKILGIISTWP